MKSRRRVGVEGAPIPEPEAIGLVGDTGRLGDDGVTSLCNTEAKMEFACSGWYSQHRSKMSNEKADL